MFEQVYYFSPGLSRASDARRRAPPFGEYAPPCSAKARDHNLTTCRDLVHRSYCHQHRHWCRVTREDHRKGIFGFGPKRGGKQGWTLLRNFGKSRIAERFVRLCPATCGICRDPCLKKCEQMMLGGCKGKRCGCGWRCPSWVHSSVKCRAWETFSKTNECAKICSWSSSRLVRSVHTRKDPANPGQKSEMALAKRHRSVGQLRLGRGASVVHWDEAVKMVSCFLDKKKSMRCMAQTAHRTLLACLAFRRKRGRHNPAGIPWRGSLRTIHARRQRYCCLGQAKRCGDAWIYAVKQLGKPSWAEPANVDRIAEPHSALF